MINNKKLNSKQIITLFSIGLFFLGIFLDNKNISLISVLIIFIFNFLFTFYKKEEDYHYYLLFQCFIFLFIISRPSISLLKGINWWHFHSYTIYTSLFIIFLSLIFLDIGFYYKNNFTLQINNKKFINIKINWNKLENFLFWITLFTLSLSLIKELLTMFHFYGHYVSLYTGESAKIPLIINILSGLSLYFLIFYLACLPNKNKTILILTLYSITGIPGIIVGGRNSLMIKLLFCFLYFLLRNYNDSNICWIGKKLKILLLLSLPLCMILLGSIAYTRGNMNLPTKSPIKIIENFLYSQGTSYDTLCQTIEHREELRNNNYISYTFGEPIDFILHNEISNKLFGTEDFNGNSIENGTKSNNLAHRISYIVLGDSYLKGFGRGTTYFSELYLDFGYLGIILFNFLLGTLFKNINLIFRKGNFYRIILLNSLLFLYIIPRLATFSIFTFLLNYYFWIASILILIISQIQNKIESRKKYE